MDSALGQHAPTQDNSKILHMCQVMQASDPPECREQGETQGACDTDTTGGNPSNFRGIYISSPFSSGLSPSGSHYQAISIQLHLD